MKSSRRAILLGGVGATTVAALPRTFLAYASGVAVGSPVDSSFFGLHDATGLSFSRLGPGSLRLWDVGVTWKEIEVSPGVFDFTRLDSLLASFNVGTPGAPKLTYVLGQTPLFYAANHSDPPPIDKFDAYVRAVASRYAGKIDFYQVWNEANNTFFYTGTKEQMAQLTKTAALAVMASDPKALIVAPSGPVRKAYQQSWFSGYFNALVPNTAERSWLWFDRVGFSMYPNFGDGPEAMLGMLATMRTIMGNSGVPIAKQTPHASEINYDVEPGGATLLSDTAQIGFTMRTYLVGAIAGFERMHWYRYDWGLQNGKYLGNNYWTKPNDFTSVTPAGLAFSRVKSWMTGTYRGYARDAAAGYQAKFDNKTVVWNPTGVSPVLPARGTTITRYDGSQITANGLVYLVQNPTMFQ